MRRLQFLVVAAVAVAIVPTASASVDVIPVERTVFPTRQFVVDIQRDATIRARDVRVWENGAPIGHVSLRPFLASSLRSSVVLAIDASKSMAGEPFTAALDAARKFASRRAGHERIGLVTFNDGVHVLLKPTESAQAVGTALKTDPGLTLGTRVYDAVTESATLLKAAPAASRVIVLLSDGADIGSVETLETAIAAARRNHVRVFTIGLSSKAFDPEPLRTLARETGAEYFEVESAVQLAPIYAAVGHRLANQYLIVYQSKAIRKSAVTMRLDVRGVGSTTFDYTAPSASSVSPFHRSFLTRFAMSPAAMVLISLLVAGAIALLVGLGVRKRPSGMTGRVEHFLSGVKSAERLKNTGKNVRGSLASSQRAEGWLRDLDNDLEIANVSITATRLAVLTAAATAFFTLLFAVLYPVLVVLSLVLIPLVSRGWVRKKLNAVREEFADQLPSNLQVLASAMRAGYSLNGALAVAVENAHEPSRRELMRAVSDEKLGIPVDEALRRVAERMKNRDLQQVALLSELQRTAGGNAAEVLDTVVDTIRERGEVRRLVRTLTAQGRMARWILTGMPAVVALLLWLLQPALMQQFFSSTGGQIALVIAALMTMAGSLVIQRMVDIEV